MANPERFWVTLVGAFAAIFGTVDLACWTGPANGDTASECLAARLDTPVKRVAFVGGWAWFALWFPRHILKDRTYLKESR